MKQINKAELWLSVVLTVIGYFLIAFIGGALIMGDPWVVFHDFNLSALTVSIVAFVAFNAKVELSESRT